MTENLKNITSQLIEKYIDILEQNGEPNEAYKYLAINTFQQNWNLEADDFYQMLRTSFNKVSNLLYQNSWGFIEKSAQNFPEETRAMFRNLYDESIEVSQRIKTFQAESEKLLPKVQQVLNRTNINTQQDERTISVYLAFRFPEKYMLYKADYYKNFCKQLNIKSKKAGERFLHLQELSDQIIEEDLLGENFINIYRNFYSKPDWEDKYLMIQNVLYVTFRDGSKGMKDFKDFLEQLYIYIDDNNLDYKLGRKGRNWIWIFDKDECFNNEYVHYEFRLVENKISIDLHFEKNVKVARELHALIGELPDFLEWKKWQKSDSITHENKINLDNEDCIANTIKALNELFELTYPLLIEKAKSLKDISIKNNPMDNKIDATLNQILFGAPGTGKTYNTKEIAVEIINGKKSRTREEINVEYESLVNAKQIVFTTFHQSMSYEDFIEGIKPKTIDGTVTYEVKDGIFKQLCNVASQGYLQIGDLIGDYQIDKIGAEIIYLKKPRAGTIVPIPKYLLNELHQLMTKGIIDNESIKNKTAVKKMSPTTEKYIVNGYPNIMAMLVEKINQNNNKNKQKYVLIIDEINRGNISAIFGELITLLEEDKRKGNKEQTEVMLPYSNDKFSVPNNVYIIGTMNTADRSVEALDTALRRRFSFVEMQPDPGILSNSEYRDVDLKRLLETINQRIEVLIDKDYQIGHSYFIGIQRFEDLKRTFKDKIIPLLEEYFYRDFGKIGLVLGGSFIYQEAHTAKFPKNFTYENDFLEDKKVYRFTPFESWNESTFTSVYED